MVRSILLVPLALIALAGPLGSVGRADAPAPDTTRSLVLHVETRSSDRLVPMLMQVARSMEEAEGVETVVLDVAHRSVRLTYRPDRITVEGVLARLGRDGFKGARTSTRVAGT